jgi:hypothetical protein
LTTHAYEDQTQPPVTRAEVLAAVKDAFGTSGATGAELVAAARAADARPIVITSLQRVSQRVEFRHIRELWGHLPELPVT